MSPSTYRHLFAASIGFLVIYVLSAHFFYFGEPLASLSASTSGLFLTRMNGHETRFFQQGSAVDTTSWLVELAQTFEEDGDDMIAIAIYRRLTEAIIPRDGTMRDINRTSLS